MPAHGQSVKWDGAVQKLLLLGCQKWRRNPPADNAGEACDLGGRRFVGAGFHPAFGFRKPKPGGDPAGPRLWETLLAGRAETRLKRMERDRRRVLTDGRRIAERCGLRIGRPWEDRKPARIRSRRRPRSGLGLARVRGNESGSDSPRPSGELDHRINSCRKPPTLVSARIPRSGADHHMRGSTV